MKFFPFICIITMFFSCQQASSDKQVSSDTSSLSGSDSISFVQKNYSEKTSMPCENCPVAELKIAEAQGNAALVQTVNDSVFLLIRRALNIGETTDSSLKNYKDILKGFLSGYERQRKEYPDAPAGWAAQINIGPTFQNPKILALLANGYVMTGGAHGLSTQHAMIFSKAKNAEIEKEELFSDLTAFTRLAEKKFRQKYAIAADSTINSKGFSFEGNKFYLPNDILIKKEGLHLYYNSYDIASYAEGPKDVLISWQEARPFLNPDII